MKPDILVKIDQIVDANLDMAIVAVAESTVIDACYTWLKAQPDADDVEIKANLNYKGAQISAATAPMGSPGYVIQLRSKPAVPVTEG
jgi:hypothetical protein